MWLVHANDDVNTKCGCVAYVFGRGRVTLQPEESPTRSRCWHGFVLPNEQHPQDPHASSSDGLRCIIALHHMSHTILPSIICRTRYCPPLSVPHDIALHYLSHTTLPSIICHTRYCRINTILSLYVQFPAILTPLWYYLHYVVSPPIVRHRPPLYDIALYRTLFDYTTLHSIIRHCPPFYGIALFHTLFNYTTSRSIMCPICDIAP